MDVVYVRHGKARPTDGGECGTQPTTNGVNSRQSGRQSLFDGRRRDTIWNYHDFCLGELEC